MWHSKEVLLIGLTLITSAVHFADNAFRLDLYPGPAWLTRNVVLTAWIVILLAACLVYWINTRTALVAYGVVGFGGLAHYVMPQTRSMPTRCALTIGAERSRISRMVLRESLLLVLCGLVIGVPAASLASRLIANQLFGLKPGDPVTLLAACVLMVAVTTIASYWPARRAASVDPMQALRSE